MTRTYVGGGGLKRPETSMVRTAAITGPSVERRKRAECLVYRARPNRVLDPQVFCFCFRSPAADAAAAARSINYTDINTYLRALDTARTNAARNVTGESVKNKFVFYVFVFSSSPATISEEKNILNEPETLRRV